MATGDISAYNFQLPGSTIPDAQLIGPPTNGPQGPAIQTDPGSGLAYVKGQTKEYYDKWAQLNNFAQKMWLQYGIDVTKPDPRNPASYQAFEMYNKAAADLRFQLDTLQNSQKLNEALYGGVASGQTLLRQNLTDAPSTTQDLRQVVMPTRLDPAVEQNNNLAQKYLPTRESYNQRKEQTDELIAGLERRMQEDPGNAEYYRRQIEAVQGPDYQAREPRITTPRAQEEDTTITPLLKKLSSVVTGVGGPEYGWYVDPRGNRKNNSFQGYNFARTQNSVAKPIQYIERAPDGTTTVVLNDGEVVDITSMGLLGFYALLSQANPELTAYKHLVNYAKKYELLDEQQNIPPTMVFPTEELQSLSQTSQQQNTLSTQYIQAEDQRQAELMDKAFNISWWENIQGGKILQTEAGNIAVKRGDEDNTVKINDYRSLIARIAANYGTTPESIVQAIGSVNGKSLDVNQFRRLLQYAGTVIPEQTGMNNAVPTQATPATTPATQMTPEERRKGLRNE